MRTLWKRLTALFSRRQLDRELGEEVGSPPGNARRRIAPAGHGPGAARAAARREFGGIEQMKELYRDRRGIPWIETGAKDMRYGLRGLRRNPGFTAAAVSRWRSGIGANTAIFSLFHTLMLRMLPVARARANWCLCTAPAAGARAIRSYPLYLELRQTQRSFHRRFGAQRRRKSAVHAPGRQAVDYPERVCHRQLFQRAGSGARAWGGSSPTTTTACRRAIPWSC